MPLVMHAAALDANDLATSLLKPPAAEPLSGDILVRQRVLHRDGRIVTGTWESDPGLSRWDFADHGEVIHILSGRMIVSRDGGEAVELAAGATAVFEPGWTGEWQVLETLRKVFMVY